MTTTRSGGQVLVDALKTHGIDTVFGVPGESYLEALDALYGARDAIRFIACRQEGGAAYMAEAYAKLSGRPGVCFVTRGPGATNASIGVHTAYQNSTPMILLIGQVPRQQMEREAFQEIDYRRMYGPLTKWVAQIDDPDRIPEQLSRACHQATAGRPGPVALALPEDMLRQTSDVADVEPYRTVQSHPSHEDLQQLRCLLAQAQRPLLIVGGSVWNEQACADILTFAEANQLPVSVSFRHQDHVDNSHHCYVGDVAYGIFPALAERVREADLLLVVGARLNEGTSIRYQLIQPPRPAQKLIHIHAGAEELGRVYQADLAINASVIPCAAALKQLDPINPAPWNEWRTQARAEYLAALELNPQPGSLDMGQVMATLRERLPADAILTSGAGNFSDWPNKYYQYRQLGTMLAPVSGAMGYSVPSAVAAKLARPNSITVGFAGDGDFLMNGQELATAMQYDLNPILLVINNSMYGTIRMHQERHHPGRTIGTSLRNPDFAAYARAFGAYGEVVETTEQFAPAFERALESGLAAVLELRIDPECLGPDMRLSQLGPQS